MFAPLPNRDHNPVHQSDHRDRSCYEIYGGKVYDLLNDRLRLDVREDAKRRVVVVGLREVETRDAATLQVGVCVLGGAAAGGTAAGRAVPVGASL